MTIEKQKSPKNRMNPSVLAQIANLPSLSIKELNALWYKLYGKAPTVQRRSPTAHREAETAKAHRG